MPGHECGIAVMDGPTLLEPDSRTLFEQKDGRWWFTFEAIADTKTVYDGEAEVVGEVTQSFTIPVIYCPYCGKKL